MQTAILINYFSKEAINVKRKNKVKKGLMFLVLILTACLISSCEKEITAPSASQKIIGAWIFKGYDDQDFNVSVFQRSAGLDSSTAGFIFFQNGKLLERKNSGWCGTPPISYANFPGTWESQSDSALKINVGYWGGMTEYNLKILSVDRFQLKVTYLYPL
jgi:hypothetical protein